MKLWKSDAKRLDKHPVECPNPCDGTAFEAHSRTAAARVVWCSGSNKAVAYCGGEVVAMGDLLHLPYAFLGDAIFNTGPRGDGVDRAQANSDFRDLLYQLAENDVVNE